LLRRTDLDVAGEIVELFRARIEAYEAQIKLMKVTDMPGGVVFLINQQYLK